MKQNYKLLKQYIKQHYGTQRAFARAMLMKENALSRKLNGKAGWLIGEVKKAVDLLEIPAQDAIFIFLTGGE